MNGLTPEQLAVPLDYFEKEPVPFILLTDAQLQITRVDDSTTQRYRLGDRFSGPEALDAVAKHVSNSIDQPLNTIILNARPRGKESTIYNYNPGGQTCTGPKYIGKVVQLALLGHPRIITHLDDNKDKDPYMMNTGLAIGLSANVRHRIFYTGNGKYLRTMFMGYDVTVSAC
jgi:hypothetical protein